jgi:erythronate-4-phosphate dehydrogenase
MKIVADENIPFVAECFSSLGKVEAVPGQEITPSIVANADALLVRSVTRVNSDLLAGSKIRFVGTATIGFDHIDIDFLREHQIGFASAPGSNANSVAEYVIAALLEVAQKGNNNLQGKSIGIIGVGNVGSRVEKKAKALGMNVFLNDPPLQRQTGDPKYLSIEELFDCDFITLHTPLTFEGIDKTLHLANEKFFKSLKTGCIFLNTSRGGVVDSRALKAAIKSGRLEAVVLDVWEDEPNIDTELLEMVDIGTPHIAGYSLDGKVVGMIMIYKAACKYFGLEAKFDAESFLPPPDVPELTINLHPVRKAGSNKAKPGVKTISNGASEGSEQDVLRAAIEKIYDIKEDDARLRQILNMPAEKRGKFFEQLRVNYPVHREFHNTKIRIKDRNSSLAKKLKGIGFLLAQE